MGFLDFFRKSKEPIEPAPRVLQVEKNKIERTITRNGEIQIDFTEEHMMLEKIMIALDL